MDWGLLFGDVSTQAVAAISAIIPLGVAVIVPLVGISLALRVMSKFGAKR